LENAPQHHDANEQSDPRDGEQCHSTLGEGAPQPRSAPLGDIDLLDEGVLGADTRGIWLI
jgi:hypothetical protein